MGMTVNLLPWREQLRKERRQAFCLLLLSIAVTVAGATLLVDRQLRADIGEWRAGNEQLRHEAVAVDAGLEEIRRLRQQDRDIAERLVAIRRLQELQPATVRFLEEVARAAPPDIQLDLLQRQEGRLLIEGVASSNKAVAEFMRSLNAEWQFQPSLQRISTVDAASVDDGSALLSAFVLTLDMTYSVDSTAASSTTSLADEGG